MNPITQFTNCYTNKIVYQFSDSYACKSKKTCQTTCTNIAKSSFANLQRAAEHSPQMPRDEYIFNQLLKTFEKKKQRHMYFSIARFLHMSQFNPHSLIYTKWLKQCIRPNHLELATIIFKHFKSNHTIAKSEENLLFVYTILIEMYGKNGRLGLCLSLFREIKNLGIKPNQACYCTLIRACGKNHQPKLALSFWKKMKKEQLPIDDIMTLSTVVDAFSWDVSIKHLERELPSSLVGRVQTIQKQGEKEGKFDFHKYSPKLAEWILDYYLVNKKDTSSLSLVTGIGKNNKSRKLFSMKSHLIAFLENYPLERYTLTIKPVKRNLGNINILFSKKHQIDSLASSLSGLVHSLSRLSRIYS